MPSATYYRTSQEWLDNSINLIEAHPTTVGPSNSNHFDLLNHLPSPIRALSPPTYPVPLHRTSRRTRD